MTAEALPNPHDTLRRRLRRLLGTLLLLVVCAGVAGIVGLLQASGTVTKLSKGYAPANDANTAALTDIVDAETAVRGYLLTGERLFLQPYQQQRAHVLPNIDTVASSLHAVGVHHLDAQIAEQRALAEQWLTEYADPIARSASPSTAASMSTQQAKALLDRFRAANNAVGTALRDERAALRQHLNDVYSVAVPLIAVAVGVALLIGAGYGLRAVRRLSRPLGDLSNAVRRIDDGDFTVRADETAGPAEIRAVAHAVNTLAAHAEEEQATERLAAKLRERSRAVSSRIRSAPDSVALAEQFASDIGTAFAADRVWLVTFVDPDGPPVSLRWDRAGLLGVRPTADAELVAARELAGRLWRDIAALAVDDHATDPLPEVGAELRPSIRAMNAGASLIAPVGYQDTPLGLVWLATSEPRAWPRITLDLLRYLSSEFSYALVQQHVIDQQRRAVAELRELDQAKANFVATVSHELRTPLTSISGYLEMVRDGDGGPIPAPAERMLETAERNATRLRNLIEDLLTQSRIDAGRLRMSIGPVAVDRMIRDVVGALAPIATAAGIALAVDGDGAGLVVDGDAQQLDQVLTNLTSNAIKFTPAGGRVALRAGEDRDDVVIEVVDTGIGIPADELPKLATRFFRASNATSAAMPGTGLGLAIVREIVERHGGSVDIESAVGRGSTFRIRLPRRAPRPTEAPALAQPRNPLNTR